MNAIEVPPDQCHATYNGLRCVLDAAELVDMRPILDDTDAPADIPMCQLCATEWRSRSAGEKGP